MKSWQRPLFATLLGISGQVGFTVATAPVQAETIAPAPGEYADSLASGVSHAGDQEPRRESSLAAPRRELARQAEAGEDSLNSRSQILPFGCANAHEQGGSSEPTTSGEMGLMLFMSPKGSLGCSSQSEFRKVAESQRYSPETVVSPFEESGDDRADRTDWPSPVDDTTINSLILFDQLEYRSSDGGAFNWEGLGWVGGDVNRLWIKTRGESSFVDGSGNSEIQLLYGRLVSPYFDVVAGVRYDQNFRINENRGRAFGVIGIQGITPYWLDLEASLFLSQNGDLSGRLETRYNWFLTQKIVLQPLVELELAAQRVPNFGIGSGFNSVELGLRLRYEIKREFAPYIGVSWKRALGATASLEQREGANIDNLTFLTGVRLMF